MGIKTILGTVLTLAGVLALIYAVVEIFDSATGGLTKGSTWAALVLGFVIFGAGVKIIVSTPGK